MSRLTKRYKNGKVTLDKDAFSGEIQETLDIEVSAAMEPIQKAIAELAEYEDAEEKGLLVNLPCKAGDTVYDISYQVNDSGILEFIVESIRIEKNCVYYYLSAEFSIMTMNDKVCDDDFGKTVFLTPEAAQQALKARADK